MNIISILLAALLGIAVATAEADTIYKWTDRDGTVRFSDQAPPQDAENVETIQKEASGTAPEQPAAPGSQRRSSYNKMIEEANRETEAHEKEQQEKAARQRTEAEKQANAKQQGKIKAQRRALEEQIAQLQARALGPTFTEGMRKAQIEKLQAQIRALDSTSQ